MATSEQLDQLRQDLQSENDDFRTQLLELRQVLQVNMPHHENEDNMDILINSHMRDISAENRPQMSSAGLELNNKQFNDLSNHELHQIKKIHEKDHKEKPRTVLDENLGEIMDKCINFLTYSFDGYSKKYYEAEIMENIYDSDKSTYEIIKINLIALSLFIRDDNNILYIGIMLIVLSMMMYLVNITTS